MARRVSKKKTNENKEMNDIMEIYKNGFSVEGDEEGLTW